jgi:adenylyltransferase/sulfurtransferase
MLLPGIGESGQQRLSDATILLLGCGALGSVAADMLARAGVGHLVIVDRDIVELTNLQRQVLFDEQDVEDGLPKAEAAKRHIGRINSQVRVTAIVDDLNHTNIERHGAGADVLLDGLDNLETRFLANDLAVSRGVPYVYGAAVGTTGMALPILPHTGRDTTWEKAGRATPCLRCIFEEPPPPGTMPTCDTVGVLGSVVATIANFQVSETLKILTGNVDATSGRMLQVDAWSNDLNQLDVTSAFKNGDCPCCGQRRFDYLDGRAGSSAEVLCGRDAVQLRHRQHGYAVDFETLAARLERYGDITMNNFLLSAHITDGDGRFEITLFPDGRAIIKGTHEPDVARTVYSRYIGS